MNTVLSIIGLVLCAVFASTVFSLFIQMVRESSRNEFEFSVAMEKKFRAMVIEAGIMFGYVIIFATVRLLTDI